MPRQTRQAQAQRPLVLASHFYTTLRWLSLSKPPSSLALSCGPRKSIFNIWWLPVAEPVEAPTARLFPQRAFRCFDRLNHRISACRTFRWLSLPKPPTGLSPTVGVFKAIDGKPTGNTEIYFQTVCQNLVI